MKISLSQITSLCLLFAVFSCGRNSEKVAHPDNFSFELVDSIQVDFLGEMKLIDYDAKEDKYLLTTDFTEKYLEIDSEGNILREKDFTTDAKDAVGFVLGSGYLEGEVIILSETKGFLLYQDGNRIGEITVPYKFVPYMIYPKLGAFKYGNRLYYPKPMPESLYSLGQEGGKFYSEMYHRPFIEGQDLTSGDTLSALSLPQTSDILDGQMHGMLFPVVSDMENLVLLGTWVEPKIYVYKKVNGDIVYDKTVRIAIPDWVAYTPAELEDREGFYTQNYKRTNGGLVDILQVEDYYVAIYNKGIEENRMPEPDEDRDKYNLAIKMKNPFYAAIFDQDFKQLAVNIPFPATSAAPRVVNRKGEIVVSKDASLSETEDDWIILYKVKLQVE
ncbi:hypothetical protein [Algoriphagus chordae]|uniref:DUF4221 domain-containing protein n=1 Tax=Algoriphagus chordae TaxID=237019 RepID=A0A2W7QRL0_9BACT|nr:hypothetical protein [Algoriphagus chordae]PZX50621.1 hypothetical protein LV85_02728 [Algoriphagus chordae]